MNTLTLGIPKIRDKKANQRNVAPARYKPYIIWIVVGVLGSMTTVNSARKNSVAFGFKPFVTKPKPNARTADSAGSRVVSPSINR
jgi:hypothetical protein